MRCERCNRVAKSLQCGLCAGCLAIVKLEILDMLTSSQDSVRGRPRKGYGKIWRYMRARSKPKTTDTLWSEFRAVQQGRVNIMSADYVRSGRLVKKGD